MNTDIVEKTSMKLPQPTGQRLLVRPKAALEKIGNIYIPENAQEKTCEGKILALGYGKLEDDKTRRPFGVTVGQRVLFGKFGGTELKVDGILLQLIHEDDILAILPE